MIEAYKLGIDFGQESATQIAVSFAQCQNGYPYWDHGSFPTNAGEACSVNTIVDLYNILENSGPVYALYTGHSKDGTKVEHLVVVTGVNVRTRTVYTNNSWNHMGKQTFNEFLNGVAWDRPYSYDFKLAGIYPIV